jgi:hypothetical protein
MCIIKAAGHIFYYCMIYCFYFILSLKSGGSVTVNHSCEKTYLTTATGTSTTEQHCLWHSISSEEFVVVLKASVYPAVLIRLYRLSAD